MENLREYYNSLYTWIDYGDLLDMIEEWDIDSIELRKNSSNLYCYHIETKLSKEKKESLYNLLATKKLESLLQNFIKSFHFPEKLRVMLADFTARNTVEWLDIDTTAIEISFPMLVDDENQNIKILQLGAPVYMDRILSPCLYAIITQYFELWAGNAGRVIIGKENEIELFKINTLPTQWIEDIAIDIFNSMTKGDAGVASIPVLDSILVQRFKSIGVLLGETMPEEKIPGMIRCALEIENKRMEAYGDAKWI